MTDKLKSRKFWLCLAAMVAIVVIGMIAPDFPRDLIDKLLYVVLGWTGIEGAKDIVIEARRNLAAAAAAQDGGSDA